MLDDLPATTCLRLLGERRTGRVAVNDERGPVVLPVNYTLVGGTVIFRTGEGYKLQAAEEGRSASFEVDEVDDRRRAGWSVLVRGRLAEIVDGDVLDQLAAETGEPFPAGERDHFVELLVSSVSGRRIVPPPTRSPARFDRPDIGNIWFGQDGTDLLG